MPSRAPLTGKDATDAFEDVGHSDEARALLDGLFVANFEKGSVSLSHSPNPYSFHLS